MYEVLKRIEKIQLSKQTLNSRHECGSMEDILDKIVHTKQGQIINIKDNFYVHMY